MLYCDLHGHSRKKNIFMYGNNFSDTPHQTRVFPYILSKLCDYFSFEDSRFSNNLSKESTARVAMWRELQIPNVFTMETSFCGADKGVAKDQHFQVEHLQGMGRQLLFALLIYCKVDTEKKIAEFKKLPSNDHKEMQLILDSEMVQKPKFKLADIEQELAQNKKLIEMTAGNEDGDADEGSDSEPSEDNLDEEELA